MKFPDIPSYGIIDAHMHPYLAKHRNFPFAVPENYENFFACPLARSSRHTLRCVPRRVHFRRVSALQYLLWIPRRRQGI